MARSGRIGDGDELNFHIPVGGGLAPSYLVSVKGAKVYLDGKAIANPCKLAMDITTASVLADREAALRVQDKQDAKQEALAKFIQECDVFLGNEDEDRNH